MSRLRYIYILLLVTMLGVGSAVAQSEVHHSFLYEDENPYADATVIDSNIEPKQYRIKDVRIHGIDSNPEIIATAAGVIRGDSVTIPGSFSSAVVESLWKQRRFSDVQMGAEIEGEDVIIDLYLKERPRVYNWDIVGIKKGDKTTLMEELKLRRNSELSDFILDKSKDKIEKHFYEKGYRNTQVNSIIINDSLRPQMVNVTFNVEKNSKVKIGDVTFEGNQAFDDGRLARTLKNTRKKSLMNIFKSSKFNEKDYESDLKELIDFYNSRGYRNATVVSDSIYDINDKRLGINITVSEGNKYYIRNVRWIGNSKYETEHLQRIFGVEPGDSYDKKSINKRLGVGQSASPDDLSVLTLYQNEGYLMSQIDPSEIIIGADSIDLEIKIFEGNPFTVNEVRITGNERVDDEVIRRELHTRPGELYNRSLLMQTIRTLGTIGHFNPEAIMPDIQPISNDLVDIGWYLEEQASDQFSVSGGWGSGTFVASVGVTLNNLSIRNMLAGDKWRPYPMGQNQKLSISFQTNGTYYKSFSMGFTDPWLGGRKPNALSVSAFYSDQNDAYYAWEESTQYFRTLGVSAGLGKRLSWPDPYFTIYGELTYQRYMLDDWSSFIMTDGKANMLSASATLSRSTIDQNTYPRRGTTFMASVQLTPPYSLFDGKDYSYDDDGNSNIDDEERYKFIEFHKWKFKTEWYQSFMKNSNLVLRLSAEMGYLGYYNEDKISPFERFEVGGDGMSGYNMYGIDVVALRGYEDGALDPMSTDYSLGYNKYCAELRYPIVLQPTSQIYVLAFVEAGNGFTSWKTFSPFNIKRSAGVGIRIYLPIVGTMGLDWGYGFDEPNDSTSGERSGSQFHFVLGQQF